MSTWGVGELFGISIELIADPQERRRSASAFWSFEGIDVSISSRALKALEAMKAQHERKPYLALLSLCSIGNPAGQDFPELRLREVNGTYHAEGTDKC